MAESMINAASSRARTQWMYNASENPFSKSKPAEWKPYSDVEMMIIEKAFQDGQKHAVLDTYTIDLKHKVQILNNDSSKQRPVKRFICDKDDMPVRAERFTFTPINPKHPFGGLYGWVSPFLRATASDLNITREHLPSKDKSVIPLIVEKAAAGIIEEGKKIGRQREGEEMAKMLLEKKDATMEEVWKCCAFLYSLESFLYKKMNEIMRLIGDKDYEEDWRDRARTLGPFCLLLWDNPTTEKTVPRGTILYRGANLSDELISLLKEDGEEEVKPVRSFQAFTSCSRNRTKAEPFGNVLFIMHVKHAFSVDLKPYSQYPDEEEELVSPGVCFTVDHVQFDEDKKKYLVDLNLLQQYRRRSTDFLLYIKFCVLNFFLFHNKLTAYVATTRSRQLLSSENHSRVTLTSVYNSEIDSIFQKIMILSHL